MIFILTLILSLLLHILIFNVIPLQYDELIMYDVVKLHNWHDLFPVLYQREIQQPLYYVLQKLLLYFGDSPFLLRLPTLIFSLIMPWPFYKLARLNLNKEDSLKAATLLMLFLPVLLFSGSTRPYIPFLVFAIWAFYEYLNEKRGNLSLWISFFFLFFIHPFGSLIAIALSFLLIFKEKVIPKASVLFGTLFAALFSVMVIARLADFPYIVKNVGNLGDYYRTLYGFTFLISGREFGTAFIALVVICVVLKMRQKDLHLGLSRFWINLLAISGLGALVMVIFLGKHVYPRHFIFVLPGLAILTIQMINTIVKKPFLKNMFFAIGCAVLLYKGLFKEDVLHRPYEIDSLGIATKARELSGSNIPIVSCGNCFFYYLRNDQYVCLGGSLLPGAMDKFKSVIYIELRYAKNSCALDKISRPFQVKETWSFIGGKVRKLQLQ